MNQYANSPYLFIRLYITARSHIIEITIKDPTVIVKLPSGKVFMYNWLEPDWSCRYFPNFMNKAPSDCKDEYMWCELQLRWASGGDRWWHRCYYVFSESYLLLIKCMKSHINIGIFLQVFEPSWTFLLSVAIRSCLRWIWPISRREVLTLRGELVQILRRPFPSPVVEPHSVHLCLRSNQCNSTPKWSYLSNSWQLLPSESRRLWK